MTRRVRIPQLSWNEARGFHVVFKTAQGKVARHRFDLPKEDTPQNRQRAENQWRLWIVQNIAGATKLPAFADLAGIVVQQQAIHPSSTARSNLPVMMPNIIQAFIESEHLRVRDHDAELRDGTMKRKQYGAIRQAILHIGKWSKRHFGDRFLTTPLGELWTMADYKAMMGFFTTQGGPEGKGYAPTYAKKLRTNFWRMASFAEDYPYSQLLRFSQTRANQNARFALRVKPRPKVFPDLKILKRVLAFASLQERTWIWMTLGCGFEPIGLAHATLRCFTEKEYDLTRSKTELLAKGKMRPLVWAMLSLFLEENPRGIDDLLFVTRNGTPIVERPDKTELEMRLRPTKGTHKENNALAQAWTRLCRCAGVDLHGGFRIFRSVACTVMTTREGVSIHELTDFMGHMPRSDTWQEYAQHVTASTRPMIEWIRDMLDSADANAWRDSEIREHENERDRRAEQMKRKSRRRSQE